MHFLRLMYLFDVEDTVKQGIHVICMHGLFGKVSVFLSDTFCMIFFFSGWLYGVKFFILLWITFYWFHLYLPSPIL